MIKESYLGNWREWKQAEGHKEIITRTAKSVLAPSKELLDDWKNKKINWDEYSERYKKEILNPIAQKRIRELIAMSKKQDVWLICYEKEPPCHRFILMEVIK